ncbi:MAG: hypothetical protein JWN95_3000 [Frankiales bacterium]|nr:hypothetical protein [Frankiales bacterium]
MPVTSLLGFQVKPDSTQQVLDLLRETLVATRAFKGCLGVDVIVDEKDPAHIVLLEKWESFADDDAYRAWRASEAAAATEPSPLGALLTAAPTLERFDLAKGV